MPQSLSRVPHLSKTLSKLLYLFYSNLIYLSISVCSYFFFFSVFIFIYLSVFISINLYIIQCLYLSISVSSSIIHHSKAATEFRIFLLIKAREATLPYYSLVDDWTEGFIHFSRALVQSEMQTALIKMWTGVADSLFFNDNRFSKSARMCVCSYLYISVGSYLSICSFQPILFIFTHIYPTPPFELDMTQGRFFKAEFNRFEFRVFLLLD